MTRASQINPQVKEATDCKLEIDGIVGDWKGSD